MGKGRLERDKPLGYTATSWRTWVSARRRGHPLGAVRERNTHTALPGHPARGQHTCWALNSRVDFVPPSHGTRMSTESYFFANETFKNTLDGESAKASFVRGGSLAVMCFCLTRPEEAPNIYLSCFVELF